MEVRDRGRDSDRVRIRIRVRVSVIGAILVLQSLETRLVGHQMKITTKTKSKASQR